MKLILFWIFLFANFLMNAHGTTFVPISLDEQIAGSDGAVEVELISNNSYKNKNAIYTKYTFKVLTSYQINQSEFENNKLVLDLPGGSFEGVRTLVSGAPKFEQGVKTFLFLKKVNNEFYLSNYTVGKFNYQKFEGEEYLVNEVFPMNPKIGRVKKSTLLEKLNFKTVNNTIQNDVQPSMNQVVAKKKIERKIASVEAEEEFSSSKLIVISVAIIGVFLVLLLMRKGRNEGE